MKYLVEYDTERWFPVPAAFPNGQWENPERWADELLAVYQAELGALDGDARVAVLELAQAALTARDPEANETLLYCPRSVPVVGLASVSIVELDEPSDIDLEALLLSDTRGLLPPTITEFETESLGAGLRSAIAIEPSDGGQTAGGTFGYAFTAHGYLVQVAGSADEITDASILLFDLDQLVRGIRLDES